MGLGALAGLMAEGPKFDLVGPTVDDDVRRIIMRYGAENVKAAVKRQTKAKRGRKPEKDWPEVRDVIEADAREWLAGGDPFSARSIYSIAKSFADRNPGHSHPATMKRIERKLVQKRVWMTLVVAENISREGYPHGAHVRAIEALAETDSHPVWKMQLDRVRSDLADYEAKIGEAPPAHLSMNEVEGAARNALARFNALGSLSSLPGLLPTYSSPKNQE